MPRVSGAVYLDQAKLMRARAGEERWARALARLDAKDRGEIERAMPVNYIDAASIMAFKHEVARELGVDPIAFQRDIVREGLQTTFTSIWRVFVVRHATDEMLFRRAAVVFGKSYDVGAMKCTYVGRTATGTEAEFVITGFVLPSFEAVAIVAGIEVVVLIARQREARVTWARTKDGAVFLATWDT